MGKGTVSREFQPLFGFSSTTWAYCMFRGMRPFRIWFRISEDIQLWIIHFLDHLWN
jgi:hypothetical protein